MEAQQFGYQLFCRMEETLHHKCLIRDKLMSSGADMEIFEVNPDLSFQIDATPDPALLRIFKTDKIL